MKIEVTEQDIKAGNRKSSLCCPVALAMKRAGIKKPAVTGCYVSLFNEKRLIHVKLPSVVEDFVDNFDNEGLVWPFSFDLDLPDYATTLVQPPA